MGSAGDGRTDVDPSVLAWVKAKAGGPIRSGRRQPRGRPSWILEMVEPPGERLVLKFQRAPPEIMKRYRFLSEFNLQREALAMASVREVGIPVPRMIGFHENPDSLLMEYVDGTGDLSSVPPGPDRSGPMGEYARTLALLHRLDWRRMGLDAAMPVPTPETRPTAHGPLGAAVEDFHRFRSALRHGEPLLDLALWWLEHNPPAVRRRVVFLHGDAGVNQFMVAAGRMTSVLDWELSHLGDPMWELGNARYREVLYPSGTYEVLVTEYAAHADGPLDRRAIEYYTVAACMTMLLPISFNVQRPRVKNPDSLAQLWWDDLTRAVLCDALLEAVGAPPIVAPEPWSITEAFNDSRTARFLVERLTGPSGAFDDVEQRQRVHGSRLLAEVVALEAAHGARLESETLDDLAEILGRPPADSKAGLEAVDHMAGRFEEANLIRLVTMFGRLARRRLRLVAPLASTDNWSLDGEPVVPQFSEAAHTLPELPDWI